MSYRPVYEYQPTGQYYAYFKANGKPVTKRLETTVRSIAVQRLRDQKALHRGSRQPAGTKKVLTFGDALADYRHLVDTAVNNKESSKDYREQTIIALLRSWPGLLETDTKAKLLEPSKDDEPICRVRECQKSMDRAAKEVGIARLTHHNLRDLFATECIEAGVPVPTVALWLGHRDGGALCMRKYVTPRVGAGHDAAARVTFGQNK